MSDFPFMPLYVKDIFVDTAPLSDAEFTVYHKLLYAMWLHGGSVLDDDEANARMTGRTVGKYRKIKAALLPFLSLTEDGKLTQKRLENEWKNAQSLRAKQSQNAHSRWNKNNDVADATASAGHMPTRAPASTVHSSHISSLRSDISATPSGAAAVKTELASVLDPVHVAAVIDHRQRLRKPLTAHAAHLLAGKFARCPDANEAADTMISNGWQGFEPAWMHTRVTAKGQAPPGFRTSDGILAALKRKLDDDDDSPDSDQPRNHEDVDNPLFRLAAQRHDRE